MNRYYNTRDIIWTLNNFRLHLEKMYILQVKFIFIHKAQLKINRLWP